MTIKDCIVCGKPFELPTVNAKLCSEACRLERATAQRRAWHRQHREKMLGYWAEYHRKWRTRRNAASLARYYAAKR